MFPRLHARCRAAQRISVRDAVSRDRSQRQECHPRRQLDSFILVTSSRRYPCRLRAARHQCSTAQTLPPSRAARRPAPRTPPGRRRVVRLPMSSGRILAPSHFVEYDPKLAVCGTSARALQETLECSGPLFEAGDPRRWMRSSSIRAGCRQSSPQRQARSPSPATTRNLDRAGCRTSSAGRSG
jgi:hypothetical protein